MKGQFLRSSICAFPKQKTNYFLNKSATENHLSQELSMSKEFLRSFLLKCPGFRSLRSIMNPGKLLKYQLMYTYNILHLYFAEFHWLN